MPFQAAPRRARRRDLPGLPRDRRNAAAAHPGREERSPAGAAFAWFNTTLLLDEPDAIAQALEPLAGIDVASGRGGDRRRRTRSPPTSAIATRRAARRAAPPSCRARRARPTGRCATRHPRSYSTTRRAAPRGGWLPAARGLRRADRKPRSGRSSAARPAERPAAGAGRLPRRPRDPGGRGDHGARTTSRPTAAQPSGR